MSQIRINPRVRQRHVLLRTLLSFLALTLAAGLCLVLYKPAPKEVSVLGSSSEMGSQYAKALHLQMKLLTRFYLDAIVCRKSPAVIQTRRNQGLENLTHWPKDYLEEFNAIATKGRMDRGALAYANSFLDLGTGRAGCRSAVIASTNVFLHAHNLDWDTLGGLGRWTTCIVRRNPSDGRLATVSVGFPGIIGAMDIINERGLALSFNQLGLGRGLAREPVFIMIRRIAETCACFEDARNEILNAPPGMPFIITLSHAPSGVASVFERERENISERPLTSNWLGACNVSQAGKTIPIATGLDRALQASHITNARDLQAVMGHTNVLMACNLYSVIFDFPQNRFSLASGSVPAAISSFREFILFSKPENPQSYAEPKASEY